MDKKTSKSEGTAATVTKTRRTVAAAPKRTAAPVSNGAKPAASRRKAPPAANVLSTEDIALRAYFIAEKRRASGIPGDELGDWVEAERQLLSEL